MQTSAPISITLDVTNRCNSRCKTCYFSLPGFKPKGRDMAFDEFKTIISKLKNGSGKLAISCEFEPLLHPAIADVLKACRSLAPAWKIRINTNGMLLSETLSLTLLESGIAEIYVSLDAPTPKLNAKIRGNKKFDTVVREVIRLNRLKTEHASSHPTCILRTTAMRANLYLLPDMIALCKEVGAERFCVKHLLPIEGCEWESRPIAEQSCLLCPDETRDVFEQIRTRGKDAGICVDLPPATPKPPDELRIGCGYVNNGFHIFPDGTCYPCVWLTHEEPYGNLLRDSLDDILNSPARKRFAQAFQPPRTPAWCLNCLRDSQTVGTKVWNDARKRLEQNTQAAKTP